MTRDLHMVKVQLVSRDYALISGGGALIFMTSGFINPVVCKRFSPSRMRRDICADLPSALFFCVQRHHQWNQPGLW
jgi:hypothetical protein